MQTDDLVIRAQVLDGTWETFGVDRAVGIVPENVTLSSNSWLSDKASFDLRRRPGTSWPDLAAFTPIEVDVAGETVWTGRINETPSRDGSELVINVQCEGWQYHLDDDSYAGIYVHTRISDWRDIRTFPTASLGATSLGAAAQVSNDDGVIQLAFPNGVAAPAGCAVGIGIDLGPYAKAAAMSLDYETSNAMGGLDVRVAARAQSSPPGDAAPVTTSFMNAAWNGSSSILGAGASGTSSGAFTTPQRYIQIYISVNVGGTPTVDVWLRLKGIRIFTSDSYRSTSASILKADTVIKDAKNKATALLSSDVSKIAAASFSIPDLHFETELRTAREVIGGVNVFHNYLTQVDTLRRLVFQPRPTAPLFEVGAWGGSEFEDSSMNSGEDVRNRVLVTGTGPDGTPLIVERHASGWSRIGVTQLTNPTFDVDASGWNGGPGTVARTTSSPYAGAGALRLTTGGTSSAWFAGTGVTFRAGHRYRLQFAAKSLSAMLATTVKIVDSVTSEVYAELDLAAAGLSGSYQLFNLDWKQPVDAQVQFFWQANTSSGVATAVMDLDEVYVHLATATIVDRQGFTRTKELQVAASLTTAVANQIGDTYLAGHKTQPLKGNVTAKPTGIRRVLGGETVHPAHMLKEAGQLLRLGHRNDPDTGGLTRDGTIVSVTYTHNDRQAAIALDNDRRNFEALLERFALLSPA